MFPRPITSRRKQRKTELLHYNFVQDAEGKTNKNYVKMIYKIEKVEEKPKHNCYHLLEIKKKLLYR